MGQLAIPQDTRILGQHFWDRFSRVQGGVGFCRLLFYTHRLTQAGDKRGPITGIKQAAEECRRAARLLLLQKVVPSGHGIGDAFLAQALLEHLRLPVRAVQQGDVRKAPCLIRHTVPGQGMGVQHIDTAGHAVDFLGYKKSLAEFIAGRKAPNPRAVFPAGDQPPLVLFRPVVGNVRQGVAQHLRRRTVVTV